MARRKKKQPEINYNRVLKYADYEVLGINSRKDWEIEMALRTLRNFGAVHENAVILGVGAAKERTIYDLSNEVERVFATDLYLAPGQWHNWLPKDFLIDPARHKPEGTTCKPRRIVPQHADMRNLPYEDNTFDGVFSSSSIEHIGSFEDIAQAAREIARVVKPGGIISIASEWKLKGMGDGVEHVKMFDEGTLQAYLIEPTGCEMLDELDTDFDRPLEEAHSQVERVETGEKPAIDTHLWLDQFTFTSVHIALRKPL